MAEVSASLFSVLRVQPALGRVFNADENTPGRTHVVILSDGLWRQRFGSDPKVVGRHIQLDGESSEIIGVMPPAFPIRLVNRRGSRSRTTTTSCRSSARRGTWAWSRA